MSVTLNPYSKGSSVNLSNGDLSFYIGTNNEGNVIATVPAAGKFYFEVTCAYFPVDAQIGVTGPDRGTSNGIGQYSGTNQYGSTVESSHFYSRSYNRTAGWANFSNDSIIGVAVDTATEEMWFFNTTQWWDNDNLVYTSSFPTAQWSAIAGVTIDDKSIYAAVGKRAGSASTYSGTINFGDSTFSATLPTGYVAYKDAGPPNRFQSVFHMKNKVTNPFPYLGGV